MKKLLSLLILTTLLISCNTHFIKDEKVLEEVTTDFNQRRKTIKNQELFKVFDTKKMSIEEREAMQFLYAYMPMGDIFDYPADLYLKSVRSTLSTREKTTWGEQIPDDVFRHFVLPVRVNNEYLDSARYVLFSEIYPRIKDMKMYDAVLEVNHWCHEHVVYKPSDSRTSSPLATMKTAHGRCGEESVFAAAALRAVGIPARQVYTPRWAHTDDNHAWVEVWVDGKWYYMGACEPEPKLNIAWFSKTVQRGLLEHTKAFGKYNGTEQQMMQTPNYTEINVTENYAPVVKSSVTIKDIDGKVVKGAEVSFRIYNYAEFFPVLSQITDINGKADIVSGKGDMLVWATKDNKFGYKVLKAASKNEITLILDKTIGETISEEFDINPPVEGKDEILVSDEERQTNADLLAKEDVIRNNYISTFMTNETARRMAKELGFDQDKVANFIAQSRGNWQEISDFLKQTPKESKQKALNLLSTLLEKDLRDVKAVELLDHLNNSTPSIYKSLYTANILAPRIANELISIYKKPLQEAFGKEIKVFAKNPKALLKWVDKNIVVDNSQNSVRVPILPMGVYHSKMADAHSRDIFFVAVCRAAGVPARLESVTGKVQYYNNGTWRDVEFGSNKQVNSPKGYLRMSYNAVKGIDNPLYDNHFSISKYENGRFKLLNFRNEGGFEGTTSYKSNFAKAVTLDEGYYMLTTGRRMASGKVLATVKMFQIVKGQYTNVSLVMREDNNDVSVIGNLNPEELFLLEGDNEQKSILAETGRGYFVLAILGAKQEPTSHLLRDIAVVKEDFEKWDRKMIMLFKDQNDFDLFDKAEFPAMPKNMVFGVDMNEKITSMIVKNMKIHNENNLPIVVIADTFGRIVYFSQGYSVGGGEQLMNIIHKL